MESGKFMFKETPDTGQFHAAIIWEHAELQGVCWEEAGTASRSQHSVRIISSMLDPRNWRLSWI